MKTALIVDDSALARLTLKRHLEKLGLSVFEAECVADCRYWLRHNQLPEVVFMDIAMPGEDGFEGLAEIRNSPETKGLPVIMYSGDASEEAKQKARDGRATGFLRKPVNETHLKALMDRLLNKPAAAADAGPASVVVEHVKPQAQPSGEVLVGNVMRNEPLSIPQQDLALAKQEIQDIRQAVGQVNMTLDRQQDELATAKTLMQRKSNDITYLQNTLAEQDRRIKMLAIMGAVATLVALLSLVIAIF